MRARPTESNAFARAGQTAAGALVLVRDLGCVDYQRTWRAQQTFTAARAEQTADEIWLLEHPPVYTIGLKGRGREFANAHGIPFVHSDRGGDMTYHGPGQLVAYVLLDLQRLRIGVRELVARLERAVIELLRAHGVHGHRRPGAPGVYVHDRKLAALGLRVRRGCSYHGLALNVDLALEPFHAIDPCGYPGLEVTRLVDLGLAIDIAAAKERLIPHLVHALGHDHHRIEAGPAPAAIGADTACQAGSR